jgi:hypothetical protein
MVTLSWRDGRALTWHRQGLSRRWAQKTVSRVPKNWNNNAEMTPAYRRIRDATKIVYELMLRNIMISADHEWSGYCPER